MEPSIGSSRSKVFLEGSALNDRGPREHAGHACLGLAIAAHDLSKRYGVRLALDSVSLKVPVGQLYALLGPNGAGKTTLIHILCTILRANSGSAELMGINVRNNPRVTVEENLDFHGSSMAFRPSSGISAEPMSLSN
jgi:ABC-type molybdenum transport system ATPase subunit/photorepair protein PhrA